MAGGRPKLWETKEELEKAIEGFWDYCEEKQVTPTLSRLAVFCNCDRTTLVNYSHDDEFFNTIKKAKQKIESYQEEFLFSGKSVAGAIFSLKNNYAWNDKSEVDLNANVKQENDYSKLTTEELLVLRSKMKDDE